MRRRSKVFIRGFFRSLSVSALLGILAASVFGLVLLYSFTKGLPEVASLKEYQHSHATQVFSDDGRKIGEFTTEKRYPVVFQKIPKHVIDAFLGAEDSNFFEHKGIDFHGISRAILSNFLKGRYAQGGSTITQQVARSILLESKEKKITRKVREMILAYRMEKELSKQEILNLYLSEIYLGHGAYGIGAAAQNYFNKKVEQLTLAEAAMLAGLPQRPRDWDPFHDPENAKGRQIYVLKRMLKEKFIDQKAHDEALKEPLRLYALKDFNNSVAPYFTEYVRRYLMTKYGSENILSQGYRVYTTVNYDFQKVAEQSVEAGLREVDKRLGWRGVKIHMPTAEEQQKFVADTDRKVIEKLNPVRVLNYHPEKLLDKLEFDLSPFESKGSRFIGQTPVTEGQYYTGLVEEVLNDKAFVRIGKTRVELPLTGAAWVRVNDQAPKKMADFLKKGDVIDVKVDKIDKKTDSAIASLEQEPEVQGALLSYETENGFVRAMVGGRDFEKSKFNCALQAKRQVGSTFKPLIYAAAIDKGFSPSSIVTDAPIVFKYEGVDADAAGAQGEDWKPHNYGNKFEGDIPLRLALIRSMNIPTVKILDQIGVDYGIQYARTLGITSVLPRDLTIGLGSWSSSLEELMRAYAIFPRLGKQLQLTYVKRIEDAQGKVVEEYSPTPSGAAVAGAEPEKPVISPQTAYVMTDMLKAVVREGTGTAAFNASIPIAGKTGTSQDHRDAWFIGYTPYLMSGVWIGFEKNDKPLHPTETGGKAAAPIFSNYIQKVSASYPKGDFTIPDDIHFAYIDRQTGRPANSETQKRVRVAFKAGTVPNLRADNIPHIGEPGVRGTAAGTPDTGTNPDVPAQTDETADFLQQGYQ